VKDAPLTKEIVNKWHGSFSTYIVGGILSLLLSAISFFIVWKHLLSNKPLTGMLLALAVVQMFVQLLFFLHLGKESKPYWKTLVFFLMLVILLIILLGSLWIMHSLNERTMAM